MTTIGRPGPGEFAEYFERYVSLIGDDDIVKVLEEQATSVSSALARVSDAKAGFRYADGKWSVREVVGHMADSERVFAYRLLAIARGEQAPLPAFDENAYARLAGHDGVPVRALVEELGAVRTATLHLVHNLPPDAWTRKGVASGKPISVHALAYIAAGHVAHHMAILKERYGLDGV